MRKKPPGKLLPSAHAVEREYRIMNALRVRMAHVLSVLLRTPATTQTLLFL